MCSIWSPTCCIAPKICLHYSHKSRIQRPASREEHRRLIYEEYAAVLSSFKKGETQEIVRKPMEFWSQVAISAIIEFEIDCHMESVHKRETRSQARTRNLLKKECHARRGKRIKSATYLKVHLSKDIARSIAELNCAIKLFG